MHICIMLYCLKVQSPLLGPQAFCNTSPASLPLHPYLLPFISLFFSPSVYNLSKLLIINCSVFLSFFSAQAFDAGVNHPTFSKVSFHDTPTYLLCCIDLGTHSNWINVFLLDCSCLKATGAFISLSVAP
jgi:hypothetical protein